MPSEAPWILALEKAFCINLVLEIGNVTLKAQLFSELVKSSVLLRSQLKYSASAGSTFYIYQSVWNFKAHLKAMFIFDRREMILACSLLKENNMLKSSWRNSLREILVKEYLVVYCALFAQE